MKLLITLVASLALIFSVAAVGLAASDSATSAVPTSNNASSSNQSIAVAGQKGNNASSPIQGKQTAQNACWNSGQFCDATKPCCEDLVCEGSSSTGRCVTP